MKLHAFNIKITLITPVRLAGEDRIREIIGIEDLPNNVHPLLRQEVMPSKALQPLTRIRSRAWREIERHAVRNPFGGWQLSASGSEVLMAKLADLREEFYAEKAALLADLPNILDGHLREIDKACKEAGYTNTQPLLEALQAAQPTSAHIKARVGFEYLQPRWIEYSEEEAAVLREGIYMQAIHEIAMRAKEAARGQASRSRIRAISEIAGKLDGLSYIEQKMLRLANELRSAIKPIPADIREVEYTLIQKMALAQMLSRLADEDNLADALEKGAPIFEFESMEAAPAEAATNDDAATNEVTQNDDESSSQGALLQPTGTGVFW